MLLFDSTPRAGAETGRRIVMTIEDLQNGEVLS
jgi:hypothetical protein